MNLGQPVEEQRIQACRDMGWSEDRIKRNRHAIETGRIAAVADALEQNQKRQDAKIKGDAEKEDAKARYASRYTTKAAIRWGQRNGWTILARETFNYRHKRYQDAWGSWDAVFAMPGGGLVMLQAYGPGEGPEHERKIRASKALEKGKSLGALMLMLEFERGAEEPVAGGEIE